MGDDDDDPGQRLVDDPRWGWREGMVDRRGVRVVDLELWDAVELPELADPATAGILLGMIDELGVLSDVVREGREWIVAVDLPEDGLQGWAAATMGEAAAYALLAAWDALAIQEAGG